MRVTWPVDIWLDGRRSFRAEFQFGNARMTRIMLDRGARLPDRGLSDRVWPRHQLP